MSELPTGGGAGVGKVGAVCAGADCAVEVVAELGVVFADASYPLAGRASDTDAGAFGRGCGSSIAAAEPNRARQFLDEEVAFGVGLRGAFGVPGGARLAQVVFHLCGGSSASCGGAGGSGFAAELRGPPPRAQTPGGQAPPPGRVRGGAGSRPRA